MIRNLLAGAAAIAILATQANAQTAVPEDGVTTMEPGVAAPMTETAPATDTAPVAGTAPEPAIDGVDAAVDMDVHAMTEARLATGIIGLNAYNGVGETAEHVGSITDLVIAPSGEVEGVVIGVGGFLGMGQKHVAVSFEDVRWYAGEDGRSVLIPLSREQLEAWPEFDPVVFSVLPDSQGTVSAIPAPAEVAGDAHLNDDVRTDSMRGVVAEAHRLNAADLIGTTVRDANDENVGSVGDVLLTQDGMVDGVVLSTGGILGMGATDVTVSIDDLTIMTDGNGGYHVYASVTKEELDVMAGR